MKKLYTCLLCLSIVMSLLVACVPEYIAKYHPSSFPDTLWATKDNKVIIEIDSFNDGYTRFYLNFKNETIELFAEFDSTPGILLLTKENIEEEKSDFIETWDTEVYEDKFVATVKETKYFNVGDVLTFYKVGKNTKNDNQISYDEAEQIADDAIPKKEYEQYTWFSRKETINSNDYYVFHAKAQHWKCVGEDQWIHSEVITHWIYIDAITGEVYEVKATGAKVNVTKEDALKEYKRKTVGDSAS